MMRERRYKVLATRTVDSSFFRDFEAIVVPHEVEEKLTQRAAGAGEKWGSSLTDGGMGWNYGALLIGLFY